MGRRGFVRARSSRTFSATSDSPSIKSCSIWGRRAQEHKKRQGKTAFIIYAVVYVVTVNVPAIALPEPVKAKYALFKVPLP